MIALEDWSTKKWTESSGTSFTEFNESALLGYRPTKEQSAILAGIVRANGAARSMEKEPQPRSLYCSVNLPLLINSKMLLVNFFEFRNSVWRMNSKHASSPTANQES